MDLPNPVPQFTCDMCQKKRSGDHLELVSKTGTRKGRIEIISFRRCIDNKDCIDKAAKTIKDYFKQMALVIDIRTDNYDYVQIEHGEEIIRIKLKRVDRYDRIKVIITGGNQSTPSENWIFLRKKVVERK